MEITLENIQKVVEYNLREIAGYKGDLEVGWKDSVVGADGKEYSLQTNFKKLRDAIAQSIYDAFTDVLVTGELSEGNVQGTVEKTQGPNYGKVYIKVGGSPPRPVARQGDPTTGGAILNGSLNVMVS